MWDWLRRLFGIRRKPVVSAPHLAIPRQTYRSGTNNHPSPPFTTVPHTFVRAADSPICAVCGCRLIGHRMVNDGNPESARQYEERNTLVLADITSRTHSPAELARMKVIMSWSTTQKAVWNQMGFLPGAFKTPEEQEQYRQQLANQIARAELRAEADAKQRRSRPVEEPTPYPKRPCGCEDPRNHGGRESAPCGWPGKNPHEEDYIHKTPLYSSADLMPQPLNPIWTPVESSPAPAMESSGPSDSGSSSSDFGGGDSGGGGASGDY